MDKERTIEVTETQYAFLKQSGLYISHKNVEGHYFIYLFLIGGKTEKLVRKFLFATSENR